MSALRQRVANMIGTAPRRPTHETKTLSLKCMRLKGKRQIKTLNGREMNMRAKLISSPGIMIGTSSCGVTNNPKIKNIRSWKSHVRPSKNFMVEFL